MFHFQIDFAFFSIAISLTAMHGLLFFFCPFQSFEVQIPPEDRRRAEIARYLNYFNSPKKCFHKIYIAKTCLH